MSWRIEGADPNGSILVLAKRMYMFESDHMVSRSSSIVDVIFVPIGNPRNNVTCDVCFVASQGTGSGNLDRQMSHSPTTVERSVLALLRVVG
jgi:hypothetical protein